MQAVTQNKTAVCVELLNISDNVGIGTKMDGKQLNDITLSTTEPKPASSLFKSDSNRTSPHHLKRKGVSSDMKSLAGFCLYVCVDYDLAGTNEEQMKWTALGPMDDVCTRRIHYNAPEGYCSFKHWWGIEMNICREQQITPLVVDAGKRGDDNNVWYKMLKRIEEEEFDTGIEGDGSVRFTTLESLVNTMHTGALPVDTWGDVIERGELGLSLHGHIFATDTGKTTSTTKMLIAEVGGEILDETLLKSIHEDDDKCRVCFVLTEYTQNEAQKIIEANPLLSSASEKFHLRLVSATWVRTRVRPSFCHFKVKMLDNDDSPAFVIKVRHKYDGRDRISFADLRHEFDSTINGMNVVHNLELHFEPYLFSVDPRTPFLITNKQENSREKWPVLHRSLYAINHGGGSFQNPYHVFIRQVSADNASYMALLASRGR